MEGLMREIQRIEEKARLITKIEKEEKESEEGEKRDERRE